MSITVLRCWLFSYNSLAQSEWIKMWRACKWSSSSSWLLISCESRFTHTHTHPDHFTFASFRNTWRWWRRMRKALCVVPLWLRKHRINHTSVRWIKRSGTLIFKAVWPGSRFPTAVVSKRLSLVGVMSFKLKKKETSDPGDRMCQVRIGTITCLWGTFSRTEVSTGGVGEGCLGCLWMEL